MSHDCLQDERIRDLTARVDKLEERTLNISGTLAEIKAFQNKLMWTMIGALASSTCTLILILFKMKGVG